MPIETTSVEYNRISGIQICTSVSIPEIAMNQARLDRSAINLHWTQRPRNDVANEGGCELVHLLTPALGLTFQANHHLGPAPCLFSLLVSVSFE